MVVSVEGFPLRYLIKNDDVDIPFKLSNFKAWPEAVKHRESPLAALYAVSNKPIESPQAGLSDGPPAGRYREVHSTDVFRIDEVSRESRCPSAGEVSATRARRR